MNFPQFEWTDLRGKITPHSNFLHSLGQKKTFTHSGQSALNPQSYPVILLLTVFSVPADVSRSLSRSAAHAGQQDGPEERVEQNAE